MQRGNQHFRAVDGQTRGDTGIRCSGQCGRRGIRHTRSDHHALNEWCKAGRGKGSAFSGASYESPNIEAGGIQLLQHYGSTSATIELVNPVTKVSLDMNPRPAGDSFPVVSLTLDRTGKGSNAQTVAFRDKIVSAAGPMTSEVNLEPGTYNATLMFFRSSGKERAHLAVHSLTLE